MHKKPMLQRSTWRYLTRRSAPALSGPAEVARCPTGHSPAINFRSHGASCCPPAPALCVATRGCFNGSVAHPPVASAVLTDSWHDAKGPASRQRLRVPRSMSHEGISYVPCPVCGVSVHLHHLLRHIQSLHKEEDLEHWAGEVERRLAIYERVVGVPLEVPESASGGRDVNFDFEPLHVNSSSALGATAPVQRDSYRDYAPTITASGGYVCNWCTLRLDPFPTRDSFLLHVAQAHPLMDFEAVEALVQAPPSSAKSMASAKRGSSAAEAQASSPWQPAHNELSNAMPKDKFWGQEAEGGGSVARRGPTRRMAGVKTVLQSNAATVKLAPLKTGHAISAARTVSSNPTPIDSAASAAAVAALAFQQAGDVEGSGQGGAVENAAAAAAAVDRVLFFADKHFPCELCLKVFTSEANLLQHLMSKHLDTPPAPTNTAAATSKANGTAATNPSAKKASSASSAELLAKTDAAATGVATPAGATSAAPPAGMCVSCDLCRPNDVVFVLPSALIAHIRFRHDSVDSTYEAERMMAEQKGRVGHRCPKCTKVFGTPDKLRTHLWARHRINADEDSHVASPASSLSAAVNTVAGRGGGAEAVAADSHACSSLPPFSGDAQWWCDVCERGFKTHTALATHQRQKHVVAVEIFPCPACRRVFKSLAELTAHVKVSHKKLASTEFGFESAATCTHCKRMFLSHEALHDHCVKHHKKDPRTPARSFDRPHVEETAEAAAAATHVKGGREAAPEAPAAPTISGPPKPRKVSRRKKTVSSENSD